jgi:tight adherence protein C
VTFFLLAGLALIGLSCALVMRTAAFGRARQRETLSQIAAYGFKSNKAADVAPAVEFRAAFDGAASVVGARWLNRLEEARQRQLRRQLDAAGMYRTSVEAFLGYRIFAGAGPAVLILLLSVAGGGASLRGIVAGLWLTFLGWFMPSYLVKRRARTRIEQVDREVPELVDLLVTTVEAGVAFGGGIQLAARGIKGPLGEELRLVLQEQSLGLTPDEALRNLAGRVDSPALRAFTQALIQGESLGVSIGKVLRDLAVDMRKRRRQSAEERAQKTPTKILFPLVTLILPAMFILTLGPVMLRVMEFFGGG